MAVYEPPAFPPQESAGQPPLRNGLMYSRINAEIEISEGTIFARHLVISSRGWAHNLTWTADDYNTVTWSSGTIKFADGSEVALLTGNTGNMAAATYIYYDGTSTLKTSTTYSDAVGDQKVLLAILAPSANTAGKAVISAFQADGTTISGNVVTTGKIQSSDTKTYFDLDAKRIIVNDGTNDRILIGYDAGGF